MNDLENVPKIEHGTIPTMNHLGFKRNENGNLTPITAIPELGPQIAEEFSQIRSQLIEGMESKIDGVDINRIKSFLDEVGLGNTADVLVLENEDYETFKDRITANFSGEIGEYEGTSVPGMNLVVVRRDRDLEAKLGPDIIEYEIAHELAHAATTMESFNYVLEDFDDGEQEATLSSGRSGFMTGHPEYPGEKHGGFLEEGFADKVAFTYVEKVLNRAEGFSVSDEPLIVQSGGDIVVLPPRYMIGETAGQQGFAAFGLDLLLDADPTLWDSIIKARTDAAGLQEVSTKITAIGKQFGRPGLYSDLLHTEHTSRSIAQTVRIITETLKPELAAEWDEKYEQAEESVRPAPPSAPQGRPNEQLPEASRQVSPEIANISEERAKIEEEQRLITVASYGRDKTDDEIEKLKELETHRHTLLKVEKELRNRGSSSQPRR